MSYSNEDLEDILETESERRRENERRKAEAERASRPPTEKEKEEARLDAMSDVELLTTVRMAATNAAEQLRQSGKWPSVGAEQDAVVSYVTTNNWKNMFLMYWKPVTEKKIMLPLSGVTFYGPEPTFLSEDGMLYIQSYSEEGYAENRKRRWTGLHPLSLKNCPFIATPPKDRPSSAWTNLFSTGSQSTFLRDLLRRLERLYT